MACVKTQLSDDFVNEFYSQLVENQKQLTEQLRRQFEVLDDYCDDKQIVDDTLWKLKDRYCHDDVVYDRELDFIVNTRFNKLVDEIERKAKAEPTGGLENNVIYEMVQSHLKDHGAGLQDRNLSDRPVLEAILNKAKHMKCVDSDGYQKTMATPSKSHTKKRTCYRDDDVTLSHTQTKYSRENRCDQHPLDDLSIEHWPRSENSFFCLLRAILTQSGERKRLTTAQISEYVREWQARRGCKLRKMGGQYNWISRADDWSPITPYALHFLSAETTSSYPASTHSSGFHRHSSRRLTCPRPFVDSRPRIHQWSWLLTAPALPPNIPINGFAGGVGGQHNQPVVGKQADPQLIEDFEAETDELNSLFCDWLRAPRGLGGFADASLAVSDALSVSTSATGSNSTIAKQNRRKVVNYHAMEKFQKPDSPTDDDRDSEFSEGQGRLKIVEQQCDKPNEPQSGRKKSSNKQSNRTSTQENSKIVDNSIPAPLFPTTWKLRPFTKEEKSAFQAQEAERYNRPWMPFVYQIQDYRAVVGPIRTAPSAQTQDCGLTSLQNKAREHPLLKLDRPIFVSLAEIVRDAVACLPNGEGTRADITTLVQNSGYLLPVVNQRQLQQCVSSALDRLQGEAYDPSVYFNGTRRVWICRHRHRTPEEFAELHEVRCAINETKKTLQRGGVPARRPVQRHCPERRLTNSEKSGHHRGSLSHQRSEHNLSGRHIASHIDRDYGYGSADYRRKLNDLDDDDDDIPDIEELEAANELAMLEYGDDDDDQQSDSSFNSSTSNGNNHHCDPNLLIAWDGDEDSDACDRMDYEVMQFDMKKGQNCYDPYRSAHPVSFSVNRSTTPNQSNSQQGVSQRAPLESPVQHQQHRMKPSISKSRKDLLYKRKIHYTNKFADQSVEYTAHGDERSDRNYVDDRF